jgi:protein TonB
MARFQLLIGASAAALALAASPAAAETGSVAQTPPPLPRIYAVPPPPPPPPPRAAFPRRAMLRIGFISDDDYPATALRAGAQGQTTIRYLVGAGGRVEACDVVQSSGNEDLDRTSCALMLQRFVFMPALDEQGRAVAESRQQRIRWVLPEPVVPECREGEANCLAVPSPPLAGPPAPPPPPAPLGPFGPPRAPPVLRPPVPPVGRQPWQPAPEAAPPAPPQTAQPPR